MSGSHLSKDFFELVKSIGEAKSKQEEDRIIIQEISNLKRRMTEVSTSTSNISTNTLKKKQKEFLIRLMYVEMLGHDASFGYIKAVELTASTNLLQKRVGYLTCSLVLSPTHEFRFMIINQLQRDLQSSNHLEVCAALITVCKLVTNEMIPAVSPMITDLLRHDNELVRKKAVMALHRFHQLNADSVKGLNDNLRRTLCDKDPSVMGASLCILYDLGRNNPIEYKDLVPSYVSILKQITEHRLPREFDYHRIPAPWIQIRLLKILSVLGQADQVTSEGMYEVLHDVMRRADTGINVGYAIIYECVCTVTNIYPNSTLLDAAAASISRFISSDNHNLKYLGVTGLASIVKDHPRYATAHQMAVIDCLEDPDETLKRKTLDLLYRMTNPANVEFITAKLTQFLRETTDMYLRTELVNRITQCAERYAPSNSWYIQTMTNVFELGGDLVKEEVAHNLLHLIAEGNDDDEHDTKDDDKDLKKDAVETYLILLDKPVLPDILVQVMCWILGEYAMLSTDVTLNEISDRLCDMVDRPFAREDVTRGYIISAILKICARMGGKATPLMKDVIQKYVKSRSTDIQQRCLEFQEFIDRSDIMQTVLPEDSSFEDIDIDPNLEFLQGYVNDALSKGASKYSPPQVESDDEDYHRRERKGMNKNSLNFQAYEKPELPYAGRNLKTAGLESDMKWGGQIQQPQQQMPLQQAYQSPGNTYGGSQQFNENAPVGGANAAMWNQASIDNNVKRPIKNVWGPSGLNTPEKQTPPLQPHPMPQNTYPPALAPPQQGSYPTSQPAYPIDPYNRYPAEQSQVVPPTYASDGNTSTQIHDESDAQIDERQMLASALFQGLPGASASVPVKGEKKPRKSSKTSALSKRNSRTGRGSIKETQGDMVENERQSNNTVDLLDISFDSNPQQVTTSTTTPDPFGMGSLQTSLPQSNLAGGFIYNGGHLLPLQVSTQEFGSMWGNFRCEKKCKTPSTTVNTLDEYIKRMSFNKIHPVEAISQTKEVIAAAKLSHNNSLICLIHAKLRSSGYIDLTIRTSDQTFTENLSNFIITCLK